MRPRIAVGTSLLHKVLQNVTPSHLLAVRNVLRYLSGTTTYHLVINRGSGLPHTDH